MIIIFNFPDTMFSTMVATLKSIKYFAHTSSIPHQGVLKIIMVNSNFITPEIY